jgi:hypothetical protein
MCGTGAPPPTDVADGDGLDGDVPDGDAADGAALPAAVKRGLQVLSSAEPVAPGSAADISFALRTAGDRVQEAMLASLPTKFDDDDDDDDDGDGGDYAG